MMNKAFQRKRSAAVPFGGMDRETFVNLTRPAVVNQRYQDDGETAVIDIDGYIGRDPLREMLTGEKSPNTVENIRSMLREVSSKKIIVNINSPGGSLNDGLVIADMLQSKSAEVITNLMGFSASAATVVLQGGSVRRMSKNAFELLHRAMFGVMGYINQNTMVEMEKDLDTIDSVMIGMYASNSKLSKSQVANLMDSGGGYGKWIDAQTALKHGLIDEIYDPADEGDDNLDRMEASEQSEMKANVRNLAAAGVRNLSKSDRVAETKKIAEQQKKIEAKVKKINRPDNVVNYRKTKVSNRLANHEAAHAVMAIVFNVGINKIETWNPGENDFNGAVFADDQISEIEPWQRLAITMAGPMSDFKYWGESMYKFTYEDIKGDPDKPGTDRHNAEKVLESLSASERQQTIDKSINYCRSRLIRNWHHVKSLSREIKSRCQMSAEDVNTWFNKATRYEEFYY